MTGYFYDVWRINTFFMDYKITLVADIYKMPSIVQSTNIASHRSFSRKVRECVFMPFFEVNCKEYWICRTVITNAKIAYRAIVNALLMTIATITYFVWCHKYKYENLERMFRMIRIICYRFDTFFVKTN